MPTYAPGRRETPADESTCPICGEQVESLVGDRAVRERKFDPERDPASMGKQVVVEPAGPMVYRVEPCGHVVDSTWAAGMDR